MAVPKKKPFESKSAYKKRLQGQGYSAHEIITAVNDAASSWSDSSSNSGSSGSSSSYDGGGYSGGGDGGGGGGSF